MARARRARLSGQKWSNHNRVVLVCILLKQFFFRKIATKIMFVQSEKSLTLCTNSFAESSYKTVFIFKTFSTKKVDPFISI